jgi:Sec7-like guanine-nucleotide exchange factor
VVGSVKLRVQAHLESEDIIKTAIEIFHQKKSVEKAVKFLIDKNFMSDTPQEIVNFLRVYKNYFDPISIGDFLGEGGRTSEEMEYWSQIRFRYTRAVSFVEMELEPALRLYLTG